MEDPIVNARMTQAQRQKMEALQQRIQSLIVDVKDLEYKDLGSYEEIGTDLYRLQLEVTKLWNGFEFYQNGPLDPEMAF